MIWTDSIKVVAPRERRVIEQIVAENPCTPFNILALRINQHIKNVTPLHYIVLGYMIGHFVGAVESHEQIITNNLPCQRVN